MNEQPCDDGHMPTPNETMALAPASHPANGRDELRHVNRLYKMLGETSLPAATPVLIQKLTNHGASNPFCSVSSAICRISRLFRGPAQLADA
jgi:hypothetical protein